MKKALIILAALCVIASCKSTEEKQSISPISLTPDLKATVILKNGKSMTVTNGMNNINIKDIVSVTPFDKNTNWEFFYKDEKKQMGDLKLSQNSNSSFDRNKVLVIVDGVHQTKDYDINTLNTDLIKSVSVYKGASVNEKFKTTNFESVIEILTNK